MMTSNQVTDISALDKVRYVVTKGREVVLTRSLLSKSAEAGMAKAETSGEAHKATVKS